MTTPIEAMERLVDEMRFVLRGPLEELASRRERALVFAQTIFSAHDVMVGHHAAGHGFVRPHAPLRLRLGDTAPADRPRGPSRVHVRRHLTFLHCAANAALHCTSPNRGIFAASALIVGLEPLTELSQLDQVRRRADSAAQVGKIEIPRALLFGDGIVKLPEIDGALVELVPILDRAARRQVAAYGAVAHREPSQRWPGVGKETIHIVLRIDLAHDGRDVIGHVGREHAGAEQARVLVVNDGPAFRVPLKPFRMRGHGILPVEVGTQPADHVQSALLRGRAAIAKEVAVAEVLAFAMERDFRLVVGNDSGDADERSVHFHADPIVGPLVDVQRHRVVLRHIQLAEAPDFPLPGSVGDSTE